jgi:hypothetical protein
MAELAGDAGGDRLPEGLLAGGDPGLARRAARLGPGLGSVRLEQADRACADGAAVGGALLDLVDHATVPRSLFPWIR